MTLTITEKYNCGCRMKNRSKGYAQPLKQNRKFLCGPKSTLKVAVSDNYRL